MLTDQLLELLLYGDAPQADEAIVALLKWDVGELDGNRRM